MVVAWKPRMGILLPENLSPNSMFFKYAGNKLPGIRLLKFDLGYARLDGVFSLTSLQTASLPAMTPAGTPLELHYLRLGLGLKVAS